MKVKQILFTCFVALLFFACGDEKECCVLPEGQYATGVFVVNEGPFGGSGTISWYNPETGETQDSLYEKANNGASLGQFVQSLSFFNGKAYIVVNGANRVVVVDAETFVYQDTIGGLQQPRYFQPISASVAYVSQWGNDGLSGSLAKINLNTHAVEAVVPVGHGPEKMLYAPSENAIYVANSGGFGTDSTVAVVNSITGILLQKYTSGGLNPGSLAFQGNKVFALCKGNYDPINPQGSVLSDINPVATTVNVASASDDLVAAANGTDLYFIGGEKVWVYRNNQLTNLITQSAYSFALDDSQNLLYCGDAKGFVGQGEVAIYNTDGTKVGTFRAGVAPGDIVIKK